MENNLKYAQTKSSLRVGPHGSWTTLNTPGALCARELERVISLKKFFILDSFFS